MNAFVSRRRNQINNSNVLRDLDRDRRWLVLIFWSAKIGLSVLFEVWQKFLETLVMAPDGTTDREHPFEPSLKVENSRKQVNTDLKSFINSFINESLNTAWPTGTFEESNYQNMQSEVDMRCDSASRETPLTQWKRISSDLHRFHPY